MSVVTNYNINGNDLVNILQQACGYPNPLPLLYITSTSNYLTANITGTNLISLNPISSNNTTQVQFSSNNGNGWSIGTTTNSYALSLASSKSTGQYAIMGGYIATGYKGGIYISSNFGASWSIPSSNPITTQINSVAISDNGQFMYACGINQGLYNSSNYGANWTTISIGTAQTFNSICCSSDGTRVYVVSNIGYKIGTYNGTSWAWINGTYPFTNQNFKNISCNSDGTIVLITETTTGTYISLDSGVTFSRINTLPTIYNYSSSIINSCISSNSQNMFFSIYTYSSPTAGYIYKSTDTGKTWSQLISPYGFFQTQSLSLANNNILFLNNYNNSLQPAIYKLYYSSYNIYTGYNINNIDILNYFISPQGTLPYYNANWGTSNLTYQFNGTNLLSYFSAYTTIFNTSGTFIYTLKNSTQLFSILLVAGGAGGMGGTQYNGGGGGAGGGGGSSGQWVFAYSNSSITNRTLNITIGAGGTGSIGVDNTSSYQYPVTYPTNGGSSSLSIGGTTMLQVNGGLIGGAYSAGNIGAPGGQQNTTAITVNSFMTVLYTSYGVSGSAGANAQTTNPPGGAGGINNYSPIGINNYFYNNINYNNNLLTLSNYGSGQAGGFGEGTNNVGGCQQGINVTPAAGNGLAIIFEYSLNNIPTPNIQTSSFLTTIMSTYTNLSSSSSNIIMPYGYNYFNFYLYGAGGSGSYSYGYGGGGAGAFIQAVNIPYSVGNIYITNINYIFGLNKSTVVNIYYSDGSYINLTAGNGKLNPGSSSISGGAGGIPTYINTTTFYLNSNIFSVPGTAGGNQNASGTSNGYTSSGSGANTSGNPVTNTSSATNIFYSNDGNQYTIKSNGGGSNQIVSGYGSGGTTTYVAPGNPSLIQGSQGAILYTLSI